MARRFQSSRGVVGRAARRSTSWLTGPQQVNTGLTTVGTVLLWTTGLQIVSDGFTLIRTRGHALLNLAVSDANTSGMSGALGIAVASENAFGAGIAGLMDPFSDSEWDGWLWHSFFRLSGGAGQTSGQQRIDIDSKAMRKIAGLDVIYGVIKPESEAGAVTLNFGADTRMLFKAP